MLSLLKAHFLFEDDLKSQFFTDSGSVEQNHRQHEDLFCWVCDDSLVPDVLFSERDVFDQNGRLGAEKNPQHRLEDNSREAQHEDTAAPFTENKLQVHAKVFIPQFVPFQPGPSVFFYCGRSQWGIIMDDNDF
ncbi:hypothetical protein XENOCAPTIV_019214 [Xenoophorus captivus]|uniref:Uncharacterized protein n=1 Tax=Xenoophorus captivus TaxID=1517983 RepID=A0ABV0RZH2_9TELE